MRKMRYEICQELKSGERRSVGVRFSSKALAQEAIEAYIESDPSAYWVINPVIDQQKS